MTRIVFLTTTVSPHQLPWCAELAAAHRDIPLWYVYIVKQRKERQALGWNEVLHREDFRVCHIDEEGVRAALESSDVLVADYRDVGLFIRRTEKHLITIYVSERWFKPAAGMLRLLSPRYFLMAWRFARLLKNDNRLYYFPVGVHAARDMVRLCGLMSGGLRCLFKTPGLEFEKRPGGRVYLATKDAKIAKKFCLDKMRMWGYFVEKGAGRRELGTGEVRVLWVGRLLKLKRVDTIIRAVGELSACSTRSKVILDIYGIGPEEARLKKMAAKYGKAIRFYPPVSIDEVRKLMREHDVYVLASNAREGWGAVASEAMEEGMQIVGTYEAGASATILPEEALFHAGDWRGLVKILGGHCDRQSSRPNEWSAKSAVDGLYRFLDGEAPRECI